MSLVYPFEDTNSEIAQRGLGALTEDLAEVLSHEFMESTPGENALLYINAPYFPLNMYLKIDYSVIRNLSTAKPGAAVQAPSKVYPQ